MSAKNTIQSFLSSVSEQTKISKDILEEKFTESVKYNVNIDPKNIDNRKTENALNEKEETEKYKTTESKVEKCIEINCNKTATHNTIENQFTRCETHKLQEKIYNNTLKYIEKSKLKFRDKFNYRYFVYIKNKEKVVLICRDHKTEFKTRFDTHLKGLGSCPVCAKEIKIKNFEGHMYKAKTQEEFLEDCKRVHEDIYDYKEVKYINSKEKIKIICKIHGVFEQDAGSHASGHGCRECANDDMMSKRTWSTERFIEESKKIHGDKYDYTETKYINSQTNVKIRCSEHGVFEQIANNHTRGAGCRKCADKEIGNRLRKTREEFIEDCKRIHGNIYDYKNVEYKDTHTKVKIICKQHGEFEQTPSDHLQTKGCNKCGVIKRTEAQSFTKNEFIERANVVHNNKYDYSETEYKNSQTHIKIRCKDKDHGIFIQTPNSHLRGAGCHKCSTKRIADSQRLTNEEVIKRCIKAHGDKYDYSKIDYKSLSEPIKIICHKKNKKGQPHGEFNQLLSNHTTWGQGCPKCSKRKFSSEQIEWLNFMIENLNINIKHIENEGEFKIGRKFADGYCEDLKLVFEFDGCYWHGCPDCYPSRNEINKTSKITFDELYQKTMERKNIIEQKGYKLLSIFECKWKKIKNDNLYTQYTEQLIKYITSTHSDNSL